MDNKDLRLLVKQYITGNRLGREKLAVGAGVSWNTVLKIEKGQEVKKSTEAAILRFLNKEESKEPNDAA